MPVVRWRPGGTSGPPSLRARWWAFGCACWARGSFAHRRMCGAFFPSRGKEPKGDRWQPIRDSTMAAPGPLLAWLEGEVSCCARLIASSRGRLGAILGVMSVIRRRPGGTGGPPSLRARWWACQGVDTACGLTRKTRHGSLQWYMTGGAGVASVGLRRRSPPLSTMAERASLTRSGATAGEPRPSATTPAPFPGGEGVTAKAVTDRGSLACFASRRARRAP